MEITSQYSDLDYQKAQRRVHKLKRFYTHLVVYLIVNTFLIISQIIQLDSNQSIFQFSIFSTAFFWGIGLLAHGLNVFKISLFMGENWEENKIKEFMEKNKNQSQSWN